jgi:hypothetical protein
MFGYCGESAADVQALYVSLKSACANDPTLAAVAPNCSQHCHGWGYVILAANGLFHYRTARPIYEDEVTLPPLQGPVRAIFHGRYASDPGLAGAIFSHPFMAANHTEVLFLAHNGGVSAEPVRDRVVDSEWLLEEITRAGGLVPALPRLKERTKSALNLLLLTIGRGPGTPAALQYFHYFKATEPAKAGYYNMFTGALPGGRVVMSSTLTLAAARAPGLEQIQPAAFEALRILG